MVIVNLLPECLLRAQFLGPGAYVVGALGSCEAVELSSPTEVSGLRLDAPSRISLHQLPGDPTSSFPPAEDPLQPFPRSCPS